MRVRFLHSSTGGSVMDKTCQRAVVLTAQSLQRECYRKKWDADSKDDCLREVDDFVSIRVGSVRIRQYAEHGRSLILRQGR